MSRLTQEAEDEISVLEAVYSGPGEFTTIEKDSGLHKLRLSVPVAPSGESKVAPRLQLDVAYRAGQVQPEVYASCEGLSRQQLQHLNSNLVGPFMAQHRDDGPCIVSLVEHLQAALPPLLTKQQQQQQQRNKAEKVAAESEEKRRFAREWMLSHHIYSEKKRRFIVDGAAELGLTGLCMPGKPGLILLEGEESAVAELTKRLRGLSWQKLSSKLHETGEDSTFCKFSNFREIVAGDEKHPDVGQLRTVLEPLGLWAQACETLGIEPAPASSAAASKQAARGRAKEEKKAAAPAKGGQKGKGGGSSGGGKDGKGGGSSNNSGTKGGAAATTPACLAPHKDGAVLSILVKPNAAASEITEDEGNGTTAPELSVRLAAPPRDGEANEEAVRFIGEVLGMKRKVSLIAGHKARSKKLLITAPFEEVVAALNAAVAARR